MPEFSKQKKRNSSSKKADTASRSGLSVSHSHIQNSILLQQETIGNQAVKNLLQSKNIQPKLKISSPNDKYEQEADRVAEMVTRLSETRDNKELEPMKINRSTGDVYSAEIKVQEHFESTIESMKGKGRQLPESTRNYFEPYFGDLNYIRVHTDAKAAKAANEINASAFTMGHDVFFSMGRYLPESLFGKHLVAHELTHVLQQNPQQESRKFTPHIIRRQAVPPAGGAPAAALPNPALLEWNAHPNIQIHFGNSFARYQNLHPRYQARGIMNPAQYLDNNITRVTFLDLYRTYAHRDMQAYLTRAESYLTVDPVIPIGDINAFWSFVPRLIGGTNQLSKHAVGKAVDLNPGKNPLITNQHDIRVIKFITGVDFGQQQAYGMTTPSGQVHIETATLRNASEKFKRTFSQLWLNLLTQKLGEIESINNSEDARNYPVPPPYNDLFVYRDEIRRVINSANIRINRLMQYKETGFISLGQALINAFVTAGFKWGGEYEIRKDTMHFELDW